MNVIPISFIIENEIEKRKKKKEIEEKISKKKG